MTIKISKTARLNGDVELIENGGEISIGDNCHLKKGVVINCYGGSIEIGHNVTIGEYTVLYGHGDIIIEDNVAIAPHCVLTSQKHIYPANIPLRFSGEQIAKLTIREGVIVSAHTTLSAGITIGKGALIGAGSVVTRDIPNGMFAFGSPCKPKNSLVKENDLYGWNQEKNNVSTI